MSYLQETVLSGENGDARREELDSLAHLAVTRGSSQHPGVVSSLQKGRPDELAFILGVDSRVEDLGLVHPGRAGLLEATFGQRGRHLNINENNNLLGCATLAFTAVFQVLPTINHKRYPICGNQLLQL